MATPTPIHAEREDETNETKPPTLGETQPSTSLVTEDLSPENSSKVNSPTKPSTLIT